MAKGLYIGVLELTNLCPAIDGANGFTVGGGGTMESSSAHTKYSSKALKLNAVEGNAEVYATSQTTIPLNPEHIYYARVEGYQEAAYGTAEIYWPVAEPHIFNVNVGSGRTWNLYSMVIDRASFNAGNYSFRLDFNSMHNNYINSSIWYDGWMIIDLTEAFGSGKEPSKEWCDENITYFVGTKALQVSNLSGKARKVTKGCVGVENIARKIKKGYIGVGGVARPFFSSEKKVIRYGNATALTRSAQDVAAASVENYALFGGGTGKSINVYSNVDAYDTNLIKSTATALSKSATVSGINTLNKKYAFFAGGSSGTSSSDKYNTVDVYDGNLLKTKADNLTRSTIPSAGNVSNYVIFAGGAIDALSGYYNTVEAYDENLVKTTLANCTSGSPKSASVGNHVIFTGFVKANSSVEAYDSNLVKQTLDALPNKTYSMFAGNTVKYAIFAGGLPAAGNNSSNYVYAYDENLARTTPFTMIVGRSHGATASLKGFMLCAGGRTDNSADYVKTTVECYDENLVKSEIDGLSQKRQYFNGTTVGDYMIFAGGHVYTSNYYNTVDVYQVFD